MQEILAAVGKDFKEFHPRVYERHDQVTKFINFFLRQIFFSKRSTVEKRLAFVFYAQMDVLMDKVRHMSDKILEYGCSKPCLALLEDVFAWFADMLALVRKGEWNTPIMHRRYALKRRIDEGDWSKGDIRVLAEALFFIDNNTFAAQYALIRSGKYKEILR
jgi:hypothetical protein